LKTKACKAVGSAAMDPAKTQTQKGGSSNGAGATWTHGFNCDGECRVTFACASKEDVGTFTPQKCQEKKAKKGVAEDKLCEKHEGGKDKDAQDLKTKACKAVGSAATDPAETQTQKSKASSGKAPSTKGKNLGTEANN